jgi:hypothetical protein
MISKIKKDRSTSKPKRKGPLFFLKRNTNKRKGENITKIRRRVKKKKNEDNLEKGKIHFIFWGWFICISISESSANLAISEYCKLFYCAFRSFKEVEESLFNIIGFNETHKRELRILLINNSAKHRQVTYTSIFKALLAIRAGD